MELSAVGLALLHAPKLGLHMDLAGSALGRECDRAPAEQGIVCVEKCDGLVTAKRSECDPSNLALSNGAVERQRIGHAPPPLPMIVTCTRPFVAHVKNLFI
jgi:hypothetical protein